MKTFFQWLEVGWHGFETNRNRLTGFHNLYSPTNVANTSAMPSISEDPKLRSLVFSAENNRDYEEVIKDLKMFHDRMLESEKITFNDLALFLYFLTKSIREDDVKNLIWTHYNGIKQLKGMAARLVRKDIKDQMDIYSLQSIVTYIKSFDLDDNIGKYFRETLPLMKNLTDRLDHDLKTDSYYAKYKEKLGSIDSPKK